MNRAVWYNEIERPVKHKGVTQGPFGRGVCKRDDSCNPAQTQKTRRIQVIIFHIGDYDLVVELL